MTKRMACIVLLLCAGAISAGAQTFTTLFSFDVTNGESPQSPLVQGPDGNLYGTTCYGGVASMNVSDTTLKFTGIPFSSTLVVPMNPWPRMPESQPGFPPHHVVP